MDYTSAYKGFQNSGINSELQRFSHNIGSNIQKISQNVKCIKQLVHQLGTEQDSNQLRAQLHQVQHYTGGLAKDTKVEIQNFQNYSIPENEDGRTWRMQADRLTKDFTQALNEFQDVQRQAAAKEKEALREAKAQNDAHYFDEAGGSALMDLSNKNKRGGQLQLQMEQEEAQALQERESQIRQLESDIFDVNQIFKDLATMVHEQGEVIDSIEANVEVARDSVFQGSSQLQNARQYQNKARRKKVCIAVWLVAICIVVITIIYLSSK